MFPQTHQVIRALFVLVLLAATAAEADEAKTFNIVKNGDFATTGPMDGAKDWTRGDPALVEFLTESKNRFCRMALKDPAAAIIHQTIDIDPTWKTLDFSIRVRAVDVDKGHEDWQTGQFQFLFFDKDNERVGGWNRLKIDNDTEGWKLLEAKDVDVPEGAVKLKAQVGVWGASGTFDFDDVKVLAASKPKRAFIPVPEPFTPEGPITRQDYYISPDGSDSNDGKSLEHPFLTIQKAASVMQAGDTCHIRAGVYRETITPAHSGQPGAPITFKPYKDERVVISGAETITGWTRHVGHIYRAPMSADFFVSPFNQSNQIFVDGRMMILAQWPNTSLSVSEPAKAITDKFISKTRKDKMTTRVVHNQTLSA